MPITQERMQALVTEGLALQRSLAALKSELASQMR